MTRIPFSTHLKFAGLMLIAASILAAIVWGNKPIDSYDPYSVERAFVSSHRCKIAWQIDLGTSLDPNSGKIVPPESFTSYKCEGVDQSIFVKDLPR